MIQDITTGRLFRDPKRQIPYGKDQVHHQAIVSLVYHQPLLHAFIA